MSGLVIVIPVLGRPHRIAPVLESATLNSPPGTRVLFVASPDDHAEVAALRQDKIDHLVTPAAWRVGDFAKKTNWAITQTDEPYIFSAADDLQFRSGWFERAMRAFETEGIGVVGTNDLGNPRVVAGQHATHNLVSRAYVQQYGTIDGEGFYHEGYHHNWVDTEMVETAKSRGAWAFAADSIVEHFHPHWGKAEPDKTYRLGQRYFHRDRRLYYTRKRLWS